MPYTVIYYHDPVEVSTETSWTGLASSLRSAEYVNVSQAKDNRVLDLFAYARPDAVITKDGVPFVSIEQTRMNPSGHNIPQRFSAQVRSAELGVPSILYYPEYSRRTFSDPNVRYLNIRVPLAQLRLSKFYSVPALSLFWPTDPVSKLTQTGQEAHHEIAHVVDILADGVGDNTALLKHQLINGIFQKMTQVAAKHSREYDQNPSVRAHFPKGFLGARTSTGESIDPPNKSQLVGTKDFLDSLRFRSELAQWSSIRARLQSRELTIVLTGTANAKKTDSEHPWPGYLTLLDILYARDNQGLSPQARDHNLVYILPVAAKTFLSRANQQIPPTATYIVDTFSDLIIVQGGAIPGRPIRGHQPATLAVSI